MGGGVSGEAAVLRGSQDCELLNSLSSSARILVAAEEAEGVRDVNSHGMVLVGYLKSIFGDRRNGLGRKKGSNDLLQSCHHSQSWALLTALW